MNGGGLIYVTGASGAGKDSVLAQLPPLLTAQDRVLIAHRYITRPADAGGENHIALSAYEFQQRLAAACFALHWQCNGLHYGIGDEINLWLSQRMGVIVNGSREYIPQLRARYPAARVVAICADAELITTRLQQRGREPSEAINARLARNADFAQSESDFSIQNEGSLDEAARTLLHWLRSTAAA